MQSVVGLSTQVPKTASKTRSSKLVVKLPGPPESSQGAWGFSKRRARSRSITSLRRSESSETPRLVAAPRNRSSRERLKAPGLPKDLATVSGCRSQQAEEDSTAGVSGAGGLDLGAAYEASADSIAERLFDLVARYGSGGDVKKGP